MTIKNSALFIFLLLLQKCSPAQESQLLIPYRNGNVWGYCDSAGNIKIATLYDSACFFEITPVQQSAKVYKNRLAGIIDNNGTTIVPIKYDWITTAMKESGLHYFITENKFKKGLYIDGKEILPTVYDKLWPERGDCFVVTSNQKRGLVNMKGKQVIPVKYNTISFLKTDAQFVYYEAKSDSGTVIYKESFADSYHDNDTYYRIESSPRSYNRELDSLKLKCKLVDIDYLNTGVYTLIKGGQKGFWLADINKLVMPGWDDTRFAIKLRPETEKKYKSRYLIAVKKGLKYGIVNELGKTVYPLEYEGLIKRDEIIILIKDGKMGASITNKPNKDIPVKYDSLEEQYYRTRNENAFNIFIIKLNGRTGYVGESGMEYFKD